jgi:hypothetical protein
MLKRSYFVTRIPMVCILTSLTFSLAEKISVPLGPFDGHVATVHPSLPEFYISSPKCEYIALPPSPQCNVYPCFDGCFGADNHTQWPQPFSEKCHNMVRTPTLCKPDTSDRPLFVFSFYLLNLATPLTTYAVCFVLLTLVPLSSLPCYLYDAVLILTSDILYSLIDTFLSILRYINTHVFVVEP